MSGPGSTRRSLKPKGISRRRRPSSTSTALRSPKKSSGSASSRSEVGTLPGWEELHAPPCMDEREERFPRSFRGKSPARHLHFPYLPSLPNGGTTLPLAGGGG